MELRGAFHSLEKLAVSLVAGIEGEGLLEVGLGALKQLLLRQGLGVWGLGFRIGLGALKRLMLGCEGQGFQGLE